MLGALSATIRERVVDDERPAVIVARKASTLLEDVHSAMEGLVAGLLAVVLLALRALHEGLPIGHGFEAQSVERVTAVALKKQETPKFW